MKNIVFSISFAINCLLLFLLIFEGGLNVPVWLQVFGRAHPLFLHIPIGILLLYATAELFSSSKIPDEWRDILLLISTFSVSVTALMGLFLSREDGYSGDAIELHKWSGAAVSFLLIAWYQWKSSIRKSSLINKSIAIISILTITIAGHFGGNITHGENFLTGPVLNKKADTAVVPIEEAVVFNHMVQPILEAKCISCHNSRKAKGELIMETAELLSKGGKNGKLWDTAGNNLGLLMERVHLPLEHDDHMPPKGKPQLTEAETAILEAWIRAGSNFTVKVMELQKEDTLRKIAEALFTSSEKETYSFAAASEEDIRSLNNFYRKVQPLFENSPALAVNYFERYRFDEAGLKELKKIKEQVVVMDLSKMPVTDKLLPEIAGFPNLRKLNLSFTDIDGSGLESLKKLAFLKELSLSGTKVAPKALDILKSFPALKKVFLWNTSVTSPQLSLLRQSGNHIQYEMGYSGDTVLLKLTPPVFENEEFVLNEPAVLKIRHKINGAKIHYTLDGSEPDSIHSPLYTDSIKIDKDIVVKTKVFREGWLSSDVKEVRFYMSAIIPAEVKLLKPPHRDQEGRKEFTLFDKELAGVPMENNKSVGYLSPDAFDVELSFEEKTRMKSVIVSVCKYGERNVFEPESVSLWYKGEGGGLKKLETIRSKEAVKDEAPGSAAYEFKIPDEIISYMRIVAVPATKMPSWHKHPENKAWLNIDEIIIK